ncbi:30S ribosomal protein S2 [Candidatus Kaiserbacteria bacterium CG10_big_fil_rev_8_21_14_0_10_56_12]|uniref:Small ribosomal subunit protein uS2 n=1 Tax=Candidatus Kaiserbacteria bacterium CG10_big_fil_rev_8_21_14_0_10_56_12 TaxID=1974611 RepID=A0A2H0UAS4_9BACT|nr:MAG: 30S ribosomal protein S2 [Candidatus Kaiserbacteria bacterium CG10_big_fil_rev_8_21_14_0_10_56_12]
MTAGNDTAELKRLLDTGAHFAQVKSRRHPSMQPYLVGTKGRQEIFDLTKTTAQIEAARNVLTMLAKDGKTVLFVGGKVEIAELVRKAAQEVGAPHVATRWLGGTISNWTEIKKRIDRLAELTDTTAQGTRATQHTKLELVKLDREKEKLEGRLDGLLTLEKRPDALLVVDTKHEKHAVKEARDAGIPIIAIMSSDCNVKDAAYPIVANDTSRETVKLILNELTDALKKGYAG